MNGASMIDAVLNEGGFDSAVATRPMALSWLETEYEDMVARARWLKAIRDLGPTVLGQQAYALASDVVGIVSLKVATSRPYEPVALERMWDLQAGAVLVPCSPGLLFSEYEDSAGARQVALFPIPTTAGQAISAVVALLPVALTDAGGSVPVVPADFQQDIVDRAIARGRFRLFGVGNETDQWWDGRVEALRRRRNATIGQGPRRMQIARR